MAAPTALLWQLCSHAWAAGWLRLSLILMTAGHQQQVAVCDAAVAPVEDREL